MSGASQLQLQEEIGTVEADIQKAKQDLDAAEATGDEQGTVPQRKQLVQLRDEKLLLLEKRLILLQAQKPGFSGGMAAQRIVRKWGSNMVNVKVKGENKTSALQLYLTAGESDQATSGHLLMVNLRDMMHLSTDVPIMVCEETHAIRPKGTLLLRDPYDFSQKQFTAGSELIVWPDDLTWTDTWDATVLQMVQSAYSTLSSNCQDVWALLTEGVQHGLTKED